MNKRQKKKKEKKILQIIIKAIPNKYNYFRKTKRCKKFTYLMGERPIQGKYLDQIGKLFGVDRYNETDEQFRKRIIAIVEQRRPL